MTVSRLASGRWRSQVWSGGKWVSVPKIIGGPSSYPNKTAAKEAKRQAQSLLDGRRSHDVTVQTFHRRWTTDRLFERPSESTNIHLKERTRGFVEKYGSLTLHQVTDTVVAEWIAGAKNLGTVPALRAMFNDAASAKAGRLIDRNPFNGLGLSRGRGNRDRVPPGQEQAASLVALAKEMTPFSFAALLEVGCASAARPGELDALTWECIDFEADEILIREQFNAKTRKMELPKHQHVHTLALTPAARACLLSLPREPKYCFTTLRGHHYTPSTRIHHWDRVRCAAGLPKTTFYMATRHMFASYALNVLGLPPHVIAHQLGHRDGGKLIVELYGHPDAKVAREQIRRAFGEMAPVSPLRVERKDAG